ncbi:thioesterase-like superfamily-domain-containing protein [Geopyxis carbonaria]|nr:thioesterase-like superfamily-domain-containing protein [Geopyxis carbonaria]
MRPRFGILKVFPSAGALAAPRRALHAVTCRADTRTSAPAQPAVATPGSSLKLSSYTSTRLLTTSTRLLTTTTTTPTSFTTMASSKAPRSSTLHHPPPPDPSLAPIENTLHLTPLPALGPGIYSNTQPSWQPSGARGVYGGSVIAQSLLAAQATVPAPLVAHSLHCYFVLAGNPHAPLLYHVDIVRSGRSFHTRTVQARQGGQCIFTATISFTRPVATGDDAKPMVTHSPLMPAAPPPEECENEPQIVARLIAAGRLDAATGAAAVARWERDPFEWRRITPPPDTAARDPASKTLLSWVRSKSALKDPGMHLPGLAYFSDSYFIGTVGRVNAAARRERVGMMVSLDHSIHFHAGPRTRVDEWILVEVECPWAGEERGFVRQKMWDRQGNLVATCAQEGMVRLRDGREGGDGAATPVAEREAAEASGKGESKL